MKQFLVKLDNCFDRLIWYRLRSVSFSSERKFVCGSKNPKHFSENENSTSGWQFFKILALRNRPPLLTIVLFLIDSNGIRTHKPLSLEMNTQPYLFFYYYFYPSLSLFRVLYYPWVNLLSVNFKVQMPLSHFFHF